MSPEEKIAALEAEVADYAGQLEVARELIRSAQEAAADMEAQIADARRVAAEMEASIAKAQANNDFQEQTIARLERELAETRALVRARARRGVDIPAEEAANEIARLEAEVFEWQQRTLRREADVARSRRTIARQARARLGAFVAQGDEET